MGLTDIGNTLPTGFRFCPNDEELVCHYLYKKIANEEILIGTLMEIDLHTCEPWQLPDMAKMNSNEWYFFNFRDRKYSTGFRANRATTFGYWKATGKDRPVFDPVSGAVVGMRKTLVFYKNRAPNGIKTEWIMHEFRIDNLHVPPKEDWVLCRVYNKSRGDQNSPQKNFYDSSTACDTNSHDTLANSSPTNEHAYAYQNHITTTKYSFSLVPSTSLDLSMMDSGSVHDDINRNERKCEDADYGFLPHMNFDYSSFAHSNVEDIFEDENSLMFF